MFVLDKLAYFNHVFRKNPSELIRLFRIGLHTQYSVMLLMLKWNGTLESILI